MKRLIWIAGVLVLFLSSASCTGSSQQLEAEPRDLEVDAPSRSLSIWLPPYLPDTLVEGINLPDSIIRASVQENSDMVLDVSSEAIVSDWVFVLAAPFPTISDEITMPQLKSIWEGTQKIGSERQLLVSGSTKALFEKIWGTAAVQSVKVTPASKIKDECWRQSNTWAILPLEDLDPEWKVISVNGISPIDRDFNQETYPLNIPLSIVGAPEMVEEIQKILATNEASIFPESNHFPELFTRVIVTGVTALTRGTAYLMEQNGMTYPAIDIGEFLRSADILHISSETPFTDTCPNPTSNRANDAALVFCSKSEYIQLLEAIDTNVVELTGDHFRDWGDDATLNTIDLIEDRGWQYYGGGRDREDAISPARFTHNGNKIAFLGCNGKSRGYAKASETVPGAVFCDMDRMADEVTTLLEDGYLPIFTFQHIEYLSHEASDALIPDFHRAAESGAVIVSGSQAHIPQAIEFFKDSFIHYGLGNLFFDQYKESFAQRQALIDEHIIYNNKHINTKLTPIQFIDLARPRFMTEEERIELLEIIFEASGWQINS